MLLEAEHGAIEVDTTGSGPDFVIVHSLLTGPEAFAEVTRSLSEHHTVHRLYLPGFGASTSLPTPNPSVADFADVVAIAMAQLGCDTDSVVLGNGLGSFVALTLAIDHGRAFGPLIASNTGAAFSDERKGAFTTMSDLAEEGGMPAVADVALQRIFPPPYLEAHPAALEERRSVLVGVNPAAFAAACRALAVLDLHDDLPRIANSTLVIGGAIDQTTPPEMGRRVAEQIPQADMVVIPDCGHCPQLEQPGEMLSAINNFLADL